jgi:hypothetical protein
VQFAIGARRRRVEHVAHERCLACGERIFGLEASKRLDAEILHRRRSHAA